MAGWTLYQVRAMTCPEEDLSSWKSVSAAEAKRIVAERKAERAMRKELKRFR